MYEESIPARVSATPVHASNCHARMIVGMESCLACKLLILHRISTAKLILRNMFLGAFNAIFFLSTYSPNLIGAAKILLFFHSTKFSFFFAE